MAVHADSDTSICCTFMVATTAIATSTMYWLTTDAFKITSAYKACQFRCLAVITTEMQVTPNKRDEWVSCSLDLSEIICPNWNTVICTNQPASYAHDENGKCLLICCWIQLWFCFIAEMTKNACLVVLMYNFTS